MDFEKLLLVAKKNEVNKKEPIKCLTTKFKPPTKQQRDKEKVLSEGVQRFLARKEQEEKEKREEAEKRKQTLLALRAQDPKASKRVQTMLKRTKSANKSVMEDAVDNNNTADTLSGPAQPDEDDYGFVSETSSALYNKLIQKMYSMPTDDPKFAPSKKPNSSNLMGTKERVKMALLKQEEEEKLPHKRSRKGKDKSGNGEDDGTEISCGAPDRDVSNHSSGSEKDKSEKPRPKKPMPPPVDFHELLRIAEQKQREPIAVEPKVKKPQEPEVLMTKKQKLEYEKMQEWKRRREIRLQELNSDDKPKDDSKTFKRIPKIGQSSSSDPKSTVTSQKPVPKVEQKPNSVKTNDRTPVKKEVLDKPKPKSVPDRKPGEVKDISDKALRLQKEKEEAYRKLKEIEEEEKALRLKREKEEALRKLKEIEEYEEAIRKEKLKDKNQKIPGKNPGDGVKRNGEREQLYRQKEEAARKLTEKNNRPPVKDGNSSSDKSHKSSGLNFKNSVESIKPNSSVGSAKLDVNKQKLSSREFPPKDVIKSREFPPKDVVRSREFPPKDVAKGRDFPPKDVVRNRPFPPGDIRRKQQPPVKKRRIESDDEYDSEMDDFIDDDEPGSEQIDISKEISQIFGYNKNKYKGYDDDDECMESNFHQITKEEFHSAKIGLIEDLQDIRREKALKAKAKAKR